MLKRYALGLLLMVFLIPANALPKLGGSIGAGVKGGLNVNRMIGKGISGEYHTDPHLGLFLYLNKKHLGLQVEAVWSQNRIISDTSFYRLYKAYYNSLSDSLKEGSFRFSNISIPILLNLKWNQHIWFQIGPQFMGNVGMADKNEVLKSGVRILEQKNMNLVTGLWMQFGGDSKMMRVNAGLRYIFGLSNMNNIYTTSQWKAQMIQLHLGFSF